MQINKTSHSTCGQENPGHQISIWTKKQTRCLMIFEQHQNYSNLPLTKLSLKQTFGIFFKFCHESSFFTSVSQESSRGLSSCATQRACLCNMQDEPSLQSAPRLISSTKNLLWKQKSIQRLIQLLLLMFQAVGNIWLSRQCAAVRLKLSMALNIR